MAGHAPRRSRLAAWLWDRRRPGLAPATLALLAVIALVAAVSVAAVVRNRVMASSASPSTGVSTHPSSASSSSSSSSSSASSPSSSASSSATALTATQKTELAAKAAATAKASGRELHHYVYCIATRGDVGDASQFSDTVFRTLNDTRGWARAGVTFSQASSGCAMTIYLAAPTAMKSFSSYCSSDYSCRVGDSVIINLSRWDSGVSTWLKAGGTLSRYRTMVINHEVGHRLGHRDNETTCSASGARAPLMQEQSMSLRGCIPNEWPLDDELWVS
ncbi:DUF3152 domain-containing protein [uncultured Bifidobacterium sp.]|uniref:DUF3152 domain-containing protein n=1 Tax=uncultured Bifidobacterium sp. TaxID=165187 RepID=UPI0028DBEA8E|nr:DUF3152 domain-containing protein [uncultured Bifidobacterium sp.]